jgi:hypothetical protein
MKSIESLSDDEYEELLSPVWRFLVVNDQPKRSDIIFVFGGLDLAVPIRAAELYHAKIATQILITGNIGPLSKNVFNKPEAQIFRDEMIKHHVPSSSVLIEDKATNTLQNVMLGMNLLLSSNITIESAVLVAKPFLMRRCLATFQHHYNKIKVLACPPQGPILKFCDRPRREFAERVLAELHRIKIYSEKGDITPQPLSIDVENGIATISKILSLSDN